MSFLSCTKLYLVGVHWDVPGLRLLALNMTADKIEIRTVWDATGHEGKNGFNRCHVCQSVYGENKTPFYVVSNTVQTLLILELVSPYTQPDAAVIQMIQEMALSKAVILKRKVLPKAPAVAKKEASEEHRLKRDEEVIIRWEDGEVAVQKPDGKMVIRRAPEQFTRSSEMIDMSKPNDPKRCRLPHMRR
ncbi:hypothetical protein DL770_004117 [Monosporascus sp. CRB-9-2]|nr:hypothetical protein DL770_004117 [Monosporascus sp. CRB-9-2]